MESTDKIRNAINEVVEFGDQALRRSDRGHARAPPTRSAANSKRRAPN